MDCQRNICSFCIRDKHGLLALSHERIFCRWEMEVELEAIFLVCDSGEVGLGRISLVW